MEWLLSVHPPSPSAAHPNCHQLRLSKVLGVGGGGGLHKSPPPPSSSHTSSVHWFNPLVASTGTVDQCAFPLSWCVQFYGPLFLQCTGDWFRAVTPPHPQLIYFIFIFPPWCPSLNPSGFVGQWDRRTILNVIDLCPPSPPCLPSDSLSVVVGV